MEEKIPVRTLDAETCGIYLEVPKSQVNLMQAFYELYDGLGSVRTVGGTDGLLCLMTTPSQLDDAILVLKGLQREIRWRAVESEKDPLG